MAMVTAEHETKSYFIQHGDVTISLFTEVDCIADMLAANISTKDGKFFIFGGNVDTEVLSKWKSVAKAIYEACEYVEAKIEVKMAKEE